MFSAKSLRVELSLALCLAAIGIASRELLVASPNFKPVGAVCIFAGLMISRFWLAALVPLVMMAVSDWRLGGPGFGLACAVQLALLINLSGFRCLRGAGLDGSGAGLVGDRGAGAGNALAKAGRSAVFVAAGTVQFFLTTHLAVWWLSGWYPVTWAGLSECLASGIPFFFRSMAGDFVFGWVPLAALAALGARSVQPVAAIE